MAGKVRVAFVGSGGMAQAHTQAMEQIRKAQVVAFCDLKISRARALAQKYEAEAFKDVGKMLDTAAPDCVYLMLPPFAHGEAEFAAIERKIPFFVEKPINLDLKQARKIAKAVEEAKLLTCAGYMNRYRKGINRARTMLAKDPAIYVNGGWIGGTPHPSPDRPITMWWVKQSKSGGQFLEQVTHTVDLVRYLCGDAAEVCAYAARGFNPKIPGYTIADAMAVAIKFKSGAVANLHSACSSNARGGVTLDVYANKCAFQFTGWDHACKIFRPGKEPQEIPGEPNIFTLEDRAFLRAVETGDPSSVRSTYADALETLKISVAANQSIATKQPVRIR